MVPDLTPLQNQNIIIKVTFILLETTLDSF